MVGEGGRVESLSLFCMRRRPPLKRMFGANVTNPSATTYHVMTSITLLALLWCLATSESFLTHHIEFFDFALSIGLIFDLLWEMMWLPSHVDSQEFSMHPWKAL